MKHRKFEKKLEQFVRNNPSYSLSKLCYSIIPKGKRFVIDAPEGVLAGITVDNRIETSRAALPIVYGPAMIIVDLRTEILVGVFAL